MAKKLGVFEDVPSAIRAAATELFIKNGIHAASLNDIAKAAGLAKGTLYYYYPSKEALVNELAAACTARTSDILYAWLEALEQNEDVKSALSRLLESLIRDENSIRFHSVLCMEAALGNWEVRERLDLCYKEWILLLEIAALKIRTAGSKRMKNRAGQFFRLLEGSLLLSQGGILELDPEALADLILA